MQNVVTYDAVVDVDNAELQLKPGMTANVTFVYAERKDVLRVPDAALRFRPPADLLAGQRASGPAARAEAHEGGERQPRRRRGRERRPPPRHARGGELTKSVWTCDGEAPRRCAVEIGVATATGRGAEAALGEGDVW